jgi:tetratricopeptide (TPR) repeat protein
MEAYTRACEVFEEAARPERVGETLMGLGDVLSRSGNWESALGLYERARALFDHSKELHSIAHARNNLGILLVQTGRPREALHQFAESLAIEQRLNDAVGECRELTQLARCYFVCGDKAQAGEYARRAVVRCRDVSRMDEEARARIVLGVLTAENGDIAAAERELMATSQQCRMSGMMPELVAVNHELGRLASRQGRYKDATAYHEQAFEALRAVKRTDVVGSLHLADLVGLRAKAAGELDQKVQSQ